MNNVIETKINVINVQLVDNSYIRYQFHIKVVIGNNDNNVKWEKILNKRYSDFVKLEKDMLRELKAKRSPFDLPKKKYSIWGNHFSFSSNNITDPQVITIDYENETIRERRLKLTKYLYDILNNTFDRKWRDSKSMTNFLGLKDGILNWSSLMNRLKTDIEDDEYINSFTSNSEDPWFARFRDCKNDFLQCRRLAQHNISDYDNNNNDNYNTSTDNGRFLNSLMKLRVKINNLQMELSEDSIKGKGIHQDELVRRQNLLKMLKDDITELSFNSSTRKKSEEDRINIMKPISNTNRRRFGETSETEKLDDRQLYENNKFVLQKQDKDLEQLHDIIKRQKVLSLAMNEELTQQNELLDNFVSDVERVYGKIKRTNDKTTKFNR